MAKRISKDTKAKNLSWAKQHLELGIAVIPVRSHSKKPIHIGWQNLRISESAVEKYFSNGNENIGGLWGEPSNWIVDVDLDCLEAIQLAPQFLPPTATYGRKSRPRSHWLFRCKNAEPIRFDDSDHGILLELRSDGQQSILPGSVHPDGERVRWEDRIAVADIGLEEFERRLSLLAAASALLKRWKISHRDELATALIGTLARNRWNGKQIRNFLIPIVQQADDEESEKRLEKVDRLIAGLRDGQAHVPGLPALAQLLGESTTQRLRNWLRIAVEDSTDQVTRLRQLLDFQSVPLNWLSDEPPPQQYVIEGRVPIPGVTAFVAAGGSGKTMLALRAAVSVASGRDFLGMKTLSGAAAYIGLEDPEIVLRRRIFEMNRKDSSPQSAGHELRAPGWTKRLFVKSLLGEQFYLIESTKTGVRIAEIVRLVIESLKKIPNLKLIIIDPVSRTHTGEESNAELNAIVGAAECIAQALNCAVVLIHHTGKVQYREEIYDLYSGRGGSSFGDGVRSVVVLQSLTPQNIRSRRLKISNSESRGIVALIHAKTNYGKRMPDVLMRRDENSGDFEQLMLTRYTDEEIYQINLSMLRRYAAQLLGEEASLYQRLVKENFGEIFQGSLKRDEAIDVFRQAVARRDLIASGEKSRNHRGLGYRFARASTAEGGENEKSPPRPVRTGEGAFPIGSARIRKLRRRTTRVRFLRYTKKKNVG